MDNENKSAIPENEKENNIRKTSGREIRSHLWAFLLVAFGVLLYVGINNLGAIGSGVLAFFGLLRPLFIGALIALILNTPMVAIGQFLSWGYGKITKKPRKKGSPVSRTAEITSLVLTVLLTLLLIYIIVNSVVPQLFESAKAIVSQIQANVPEYLKILGRLEEYGLDTENIEKWLTSLDFSSILAKITDNAGNIIDTVISSASSIISGTFTAITSVIFALYLLGNKRWLACQMKRLGYAFLKKKTVDAVIVLGSVTADTFSSFISGQCLDAVLLGIMCFITMTVFGFPYALAISSMITVTAIIPYIGAFLGGAFGVLLMIMDDPIQALWFVILFIIVQQIDNHIVYPRVVGGSVGLPAIWTFAAVIVGGAFFGVIGMILFIPLFSVIYTIIKEIVARRLVSRGITVDEPDYDKKNDGNKPEWLTRIASAVKAFFLRLFSRKKKKN